MGRIRRIAVQSQARMVGDIAATPAGGLPELRCQQDSHLQQTSGPASYGGWIWRPRGIGDLRNRSFPARGHDVLLVYSDSPAWRPYIEQKLLPHIGRRAIVLNWSERNRWGISLGRSSVFISFAAVENLTLWP